MERRSVCALSSPAFLFTPLRCIRGFENVAAEDLTAIVLRKNLVVLVVIFLSREDGDVCHFGSEQDSLTSTGQIAIIAERITPSQVPDL